MEWCILFATDTPLFEWVCCLLVLQLYILLQRVSFFCAIFWICSFIASNIFFCRHILFIFLSRYIVLVLLQASFYLYMLFCSISKNVVTYPYGISLLIIIFSTIALSIFTMQNYLFFVFIQYFTYTLKKLIKALIPKWTNAFISFL